MAESKYWQVEVINWEKHNLNKKLQWLKISASMAVSAEYISLSSGAKHLWLRVLSERALCGSKTVRLDAIRLPRDVHVRPENITCVLHELESLQWIRILAAPSSRARGVERKKERIERKKDPTRVKTVSTKAAHVVPREKHLTPSPDGAVVATGTAGSRCIGRYCELFDAQYKTQPVLDGKAIGQVSRLAKQLGENATLKLLDAYFAMPDSLVAKRRHDVGLFVSKLNEVKVFMTTGRIVTMNEMRTNDKLVEGRMREKDHWDSKTPEERQEILNCFDDTRQQPLLGGGE